MSLRAGAAVLLPGFLLAGAVSVSKAAPSDAPPRLDATVLRAMQAFEVPGIGLAIVKDGELVVSQGYGVRAAGGREPVTGETLFGIASNTKAFTATAMGLLVEEGVLEWDAPVIRYLPWFQMWDPYVTRELTVRDLLVHRSGLGLGAGDLLWWPPSTYDRKEIVRRLRFLEPKTSFRSAYAYDNVLYLVAGEVIEEVSGQSWEEFVSERILAPVGMTGANVRHAEAAKGTNAASPHARIDGSVREIRPFASDNTNPAGGINASASDMAKWMLVQLAEGKLLDGSRLFSEATSRELQTLVTPIPTVEPEPELAALRMNFLGYALGFGVHDYRGRKVVTHTGSLPGFVSRLTLLPELELGVVVLTNQESGDCFDAITAHVLDHYLGAEPTDWVERYRKVMVRRQLRTTEEETQTRAARDDSSRPSLPLAGYAGRLRDPWYGDVEVAMENDALVLRFTRTPSLVGDLQHWQYETFVVRWRDRELRADAFLTFSLGPEGRIEQAKMRAVSKATDFSFDFQDLLLEPVRTP
jgi:CubicO group peptidase (beta-lactamase class C family)